MEKKTIGKFISALRRASGLTQKELGERLFVSDKTVSRWERDECTPELALLPAMAEIFGVTTDELLRGERNSPSAEPTQSQRARSDRQFKAMLHQKTVRFRNRCMISLGVALAALILAVVINISFWKGVLAFGIGAVVILAALVCQLCFASSALLPLDDEDDTHEEEIREANSRVLTSTAGVLIAIVAMFAFILPMGILGGSYYGLSLGSLMLQGSGAAVLMLVVCYVAYVLAVRPCLERRTLVNPTQRGEKRHALMKKTVRRGGTVMLALAAALLAVQLLGPTVFAGQRDTFTDAEAFQTFMREGATRFWIEETVRERGAEAVAAPTCVFIDVGSDGRYDDVLFPPEFEEAAITGEDGQVLCTYASYGPFVRDVRWKTDGGEVRITAYTRKDTASAEGIFNVVRTVLAALMAANLAVWAGVYTVKNARMKK